MSRRRGWFPDHWDPTVLRYWDGSAWTGKTMRTTDPDVGQHLVAEAVTPADEQPSRPSQFFGRSSISSVIDRIAPSRRRD